MTIPDERRLARLAQRLAIPERAPDDTFVARVEMAIEAKALVDAAGRERRDQILLEAAGGAGLLIAAQQLSGVAGEAAALLAPVATSLGGLAALGLAGAMVLAALATDREGLA